MSAHILITDDDAVSCQLFAKVLEKEGYRVDCVQTGEEALSRLRERPHDLLVIDIRLPGMTGLDVTRAVRKEHPALPVIVMTAFGSMEATHEGAFDYIAKPMHLEELKHTVSRALAQRTVARRAGGSGEEHTVGEP